MAREVIHQFDHQIELRESQNKIVLVGFILLKVGIQPLELNEFTAMRLLASRARIDDEGAGRTHLEQSQEGTAESFKDVINFTV